MCINLIDANISNGVRVIGNCAFERCGSLTKIIIPSSVEEIGVGAFDECRNLKEVYCLAKIPPKIMSYFSDKYNLFDHNAPGRKIYVPKESVYLYVKAPMWKIYASILLAMTLTMI